MSEPALLKLAKASTKATGHRALAAERLLESGLPTKRTEGYRFTPLRGVTDAELTVATDPSVGAARSRAEERGALSQGRALLVVDGLPQLDAFDAPAGLTATIVEADEDLGRAVAEDAPFADANGALNGGVLLLEVARGQRVEEPVHLVHLRTGSGATVAAPRVLVRAQETGELELFETVLGGAGEEAVELGVTEVVVKGGARVRHLRVHETDGRHLGWLGVHQARDSHYEGRVLTLGGPLCRLDYRVWLDGQGATCDVQGAYLATDGEVVDHHVRVDHLTPDASSQQRFFGVVGGKGKAVFDTIAKVHRGAARSEAHQENRNLLLSDTATVHTKPHLEIDVDEVVASHGATVGTLDPDQLFYLRARAVPEDVARALLTYAFLRRVVDSLPEGTLRDRLASAILDRLPAGESIRELV